MVALQAASGTEVIKDPYKNMKADKSYVKNAGKIDWNIFQAKDLGKIESKFIGLKSTVTMMGSGLSLASKIIELALMRHYINESAWLNDKYGKANNARVSFIAPYCHLTHRPAEDCGLCAQRRLHDKWHVSQCSIPVNC